MIINFLIFTIIFIYLANWFQVNIFIKSLISPKVSVRFIRDNWITSTIKRKTGLNIQRIVIFNTKKMFGMMPGLPFKPEMILSQGLYKNLKRNELEWVILHEAGHCLLWHNLKIAITQIILLLSGLFLINKIGSLVWLSIVTAIVLSVISAKISKFFETEAEWFSVSRMDDPKGMINGALKFQVAYPKSGWFKLRNLLWRWNISNAERVIIAEKELVRRKGFDQSKTDSAPVNF